MQQHQINGLAAKLVLQLAAVNLGENGSRATAHCHVINGNSGSAGSKADKSESKGKSASAKGKSGSAKGKSAKPNLGDPLNSLKELFGGKDRKKASKPKRTVVKKVATSRAPTTAPAPAAKPKKPKLADVLGVHPSALGALNAANASPQAFANASPNSRVGKLALYMDEVAASRELQADLEEAQAALDLLEAPTRTAEEIDAEIASVSAEQTTLQEQLDGLNEDLATAGGTDETIEAEMTSVRETLAANESEIASLEQERADGQAYADALTTVEDIEGELETQSTTQREALEAAANKEVTDEVEVAVQRLLGIYEEPAAVEEEIVGEGDDVDEVATLD